MEYEITFEQDYFKIVTENRQILLSSTFTDLNDAYFQIAIFFANLSGKVEFKFVASETKQ